MSRLISAYRTAADALSRGDAFLGLAARAVFAAVLMVYFWASAAARMGDGLLGLFRPSAAAYAQSFPRAMEAAGQDAGQLTILHMLVVLLCTWAELLLPLLILLGLATRAAALGMILVIALQSAGGLLGRGTGHWFDQLPDSGLDQRTLWVFLLLVLVMRGAGPLSLDRLVQRWLDMRSV